MHADPMLLVAVIALVFLGYGSLSRRLEAGVVTAPMVFTVLGLVIAGTALAPMLDHDAPIIHQLAEITLVIVLFSDASRIDLRLLRRELNLPVRLLAVGMPLSIVFGTVVGLLLLPELDLWTAALLATMLAATDAALGQAVVSDARVPVRVRQTLNVESGLNDGIALPLVLFLAACAAAAHGMADAPADANGWLGFAGAQLLLGPVVGAVVGVGGGRLHAAAMKAGWVSDSYQRVAALTLAVLAFSAAEVVGGNGFLAAFVAGLAVGSLTRTTLRDLQHFAEAEAQLLIAITFLIFGTALLPEALREADAAAWLYAIASLTIVRGASVWLAMAGSGLRPVTTAFLGLRPACTRERGRRRGRPGARRGLAHRGAQRRGTRPDRHPAGRTLRPRDRVHGRRGRWRKRWR